MKQPRKKKVGVITLALALITIGVLWTLQNIHPMPWIPKVVSMWPILLIIYGLELIITKLLYEGKEDVVVSLDAGIIILLIFVIMTLGGISLVQSFVPQIGDIMGWENKVEVDMEKEWTVEEGIERVEIKHQFGEIQVEPSQNGKILLQSHVAMSTKEEEDFKEWAQEAFTITKKGNVLYIGPRPLDMEGYNITHPSMDTQISIPEDLALLIENQFGETIVEDLQKGVTIHGKNGSIEVKNVKGNVMVKNQFGNIEISDVQGEVRAESVNGKITLEKIAQGVLIKNQFGEVNIQEVEKGIDVESTNGNIVIENPKIQGDIMVNSQFGNITLQCPQYDNVYIKAITDFGDIDSFLDLTEEEEAGKVKAEGTIGQGKYKVLLQNKNGSITMK